MNYIFALKAFLWPATMYFAFRKSFYITSRPLFFQRNTFYFFYFFLFFFFLIYIFNFFVKLKTNKKLNNPEILCNNSHITNIFLHYFHNFISPNAGARGCNNKKIDEWKVIKKLRRQNSVKQLQGYQLYSLTCVWFSFNVSKKIVSR